MCNASVSKIDGVSTGCIEDFLFLPIHSFNTPAVFTGCISTNPVYVMWYDIQRGSDTICSVVLIRYAAWFWYDIQRGSDTICSVVLIRYADRRKEGSGRHNARTYTFFFTRTH